MQQRNTTNVVPPGAEVEKTCCEQRNRGRPVAMPAEKRRELILDALDEVFQETGAAGATMEAVARKAGMSKRTVYTQFRDRHTLFCAYISRLRDAVIRPLTCAERDLPVEDRLRRLLAPKQPAVREDLVLAVFRTTILESLHDPALARNFWHEGPEQVLSLIQSELDRAVAHGELAIEDTAEAAKLLKDMAFVNPIDVLLAAESTPCIARRQARFDLALRVFLRGTSSRHVPPV